MGSLSRTKIQNESLTPGWGGMGAACCCYIVEVTPEGHHYTYPNPYQLGNPTPRYVRDKFDAGATISAVDPFNVNRTQFPLYRRAWAMRTEFVLRAGDALSIPMGPHPHYPSTPRPGPSLPLSPRTIMWGRGTRGTRGTRGAGGTRRTRGV